MESPQTHFIQSVYGSERLLRSNHCQSQKNKVQPLKTRENVAEPTMGSSKRVVEW
jgi:hypothetical protein